MSRPARNRSGSGRPAGGKGKGGSARRPPATKQPSKQPSKQPAAQPPVAKPQAEQKAPDPGALKQATPAAPRPSAVSTGPWTTWPMAVRVAAAAGLALLGAFVGLGGAFLHERWLDVGVRVPVGLLFGLLCTAALGLGGGMFVRSRAGAIIPAVGWLAAVLVLTQPRAEGDLIVSGAAVGFAFMLGGAATQLAVIAVPYETWAGRT